MLIYLYLLYSLIHFQLSSLIWWYWIMFNYFPLVLIRWYSQTRIRLQRSFGQCVHVNWPFFSVIHLQLSSLIRWFCINSQRKFKHSLSSTNSEFCLYFQLVNICVIDLISDILWHHPAKKCNVIVKKRIKKRRVWLRRNCIN